MTRGRRFGVRPTPDEYLVLVNFRVIPILERETEVGI